jgi:Rap1a immunity proteins
MMKPSVRYLIAVAAILAAQSFSPNVSALGDNEFNYTTAKDLVAVCASDAEAAAFACRAFLDATVQYHDAVSDRKKMKQLICYPKGTTVEQAREAFLTWGKQNAGDAQRMKELPVVAVVRSLAAAYPCQ